MFVSAGDTEHSLRLKGHSDVKFVLQIVEMLNRQVPTVPEKKINIFMEIIPPYHKVCPVQRLFQVIPS